MTGSRAVAVVVGLAMAAVAAACTTSNRLVAQPPSPSPSMSPVATSAVDPAAIEKAYLTDAYTKINAEPRRGTGPHGDPLTLYVDKANAARYVRDAKGPMPEGMTIVKVADPNAQVFTIMRKLAPGTDPAAGDWYYYERYNGSVVFDGKPGGGLCFNCHKTGAANDYLLGTRIFPN